ncbi:MULTISPECIES: putative quinol monooxygenase [Burkholderia cepacia complex]|uniref:putative quinol monooxygenase n=1 Tax=Burkholderia cepacia complex TaxID=87882 RepID=UPI00075EFBCB|nr:MULTISPECIES: putative quinol monooxygenase [Burkholderia cepacia complex]KVK90922.1 antibiotic biosynthesis monooxygenase [Burkholderia cepacia]
MTQEVKILILVKTQPGRASDQISAFEELAPLVRAEEGCIEYDLHPVDGDEDRFVFIERWASKEAFAAHNKTPHILAAIANSPAFRAERATVLSLGPSIAVQG